MTTATITELVKLYKGNLVSMARLSCATLSQAVLKDTPKLTGSLQVSWTINNGPPVAKNIYISAGNPTPVRNRISLVVNSLKIGDTYSFANGMPYVRRIEYHGWSAKARGGMMRPNVARWQAIVVSSYG